MSVSRRGSSFSDKQIAASVKDGKRVTVVLLNGQAVSGYVCGADDYHWGLTSSDGSITLVHKSAGMTIAAESTIDTEPESVKALVSVYRKFVLSTTYGQNTPKKSASEKKETH